MRNTTHGTELVRNPEGGHIIGFSLGADFCAEHEWGIKELKQRLGLPDKKVLDGWQDMIVPAAAVSELEFFENKEYSILRTTDRWNEEPIEKSIERQFYLKSMKKYSKERFEKTDFFAAWDSKHFMVVANSDVARRNLKKLYEAFGKGNVVLSMMRGGVFSNGGINLSFNDRVPEQTKIDFDKKCADTKRLYEEAEKTGIAKRLKDAGLRYFALSPRWKTDPKGSKYPVVFWLNPMEQDRNNFGAFTVEDLDAWIEGKGPIPKQKEKA